MYISNMIDSRLTQGFLQIAETRSEKENSERKVLHSIIPHEHSWIIIL